MRQSLRGCIVEFLPEEYTKHYIVEALFKLMNEYEYEKIAVTDIARKAGVGRATFYRYFKRKEDVIEYYFSRTTKEFVFEQRYIPRCREDHLRLVRNLFEKFRKNKECFKLIKRAHLEYLYLDFLNRSFSETFRQVYEKDDRYAPYLYAGMVFNISMLWLEHDCEGSLDDLAHTIIDAIYFEK